MKSLNGENNNDVLKFRIIKCDSLVSKSTAIMVSASVAPPPTAKTVGLQPSSHPQFIHSDTVNLCF